MSQVNTFIILSKSEEKIRELYSFMKEIESKSEGYSHDEIRIDRIICNVHGDWFSLEGDLRNTYVSNIKYWVDKESKVGIFDSCYFFVMYESSDIISYVNTNTYEMEYMYDPFFGTMYDKGKELESVIPFDLIENYFVDNIG